MLDERGASTLRAGGLDEAVAVAAANLEGTGALVFSPMFPVSLEDRRRFAGLVSGLPESSIAAS